MPPPPDTQVHRLNLQSGMFSLPFTTSLDTGTNVLAVNPQHELLGFGGANGWVECWDSRWGSGFTPKISDPLRFRVDAGQTPFWCEHLQGTNPVFSACEAQMKRMGNIGNDVIYTHT